MIGQHSHIAAGLETHWFEADWTAQTGRNGEPFDAWLRRLSDFFEVNPDDTARMASESQNVVEFLTKFLGSYAKRQGKQRWLEKTCGNILHIDRVFEAWPNVRFVQITRDPRDVFASLRQTKKYDTVESFAHLWCEFAAAAEAYKRGPVFDSQAFLEIRYEDLARRPVDVMKTILAFLDEPWEQDVAEFGGTDDDYQKVLKVTGKESSTLHRLREPLSERRIGVWADNVTPEEIAEVRTIVENTGLGEVFERALNHDQDQSRAARS